MSGSGEIFSIGRRTRKKGSSVRLWVMLVMPLAAILFQVYIPLYFPLLDCLELPLLVTVYLAMNRRSPIQGMFLGAAIGLAQDSLSDHPIGVIGMIKTTLGYVAGSLGVRLDTEHPAVRFGLAGLFFLLHQGLHSLIRSGLLAQPSGFEAPRLLLGALVNGGLAVPIFFLLDKLRENA